MRKVLIALGVVLVLLVAAVLVGPSLVDWNAHKDRIVAEVQSATGRDFSIDGDMSLSLLPVPALSAQGVRLASLEGGSEAPMVELKELRVRIALLPLLEGTIQVERILLVKPEILLEVLPDGRRNWSFAEGSAENSSKASGASGASDLDIRFDDVSIEKGTLIYRDAASGRDERFDDLNLRIVAESLRGPFAAKGSLRAYAIEAAFEATLGRLVEEGATPFNVVVKPADETARLQVSGAISTHPDTTAVHGRLKGEGENLARLLEGVTGGGSWPSALAQPVSVQGEVSVDQRLATVSDLSLELGGVRFAGDITSSLQPPFDARITLNATQLDLDQILAARPANPGAESEASAAPSDTQERERVWVLPADANGRLELSVEALIYRGQLIRQLRADAALGEGELRLERATALLPGSSDVSLTGSFGEADGQARFDGHLEAASDNLRGLLQWAGADVGAVPTDRLRRMSLSGRVTGSPKQIAISDLDLRVDLSRLSGGLVIAPRKRPGLGVGLALDSINLDAYLPSAAAAAGRPATESATEETGGEQDGETELGAGLAVLDRFDANFNLRAGSLTLYGATAKDLQVEATLQRGVLEFRTARIGDLAGGEFSYQGRVDKVASEPTLDGGLELSVGEPVRLAPLLGLDPEALAKVPAISGEGQIAGRLGDLTLDARVSGAGGRLEIAGALRPAASAPAVDLRLTGRHPSLAALLEMAGLPLPAGSDLGVVDLALRVAGDSGRYRVSELAGALGPARLAGGFELVLDGTGPAISGLDVMIDAAYPDAGQLAGLAGLIEPPPVGLGGLDLTARLSGGPAQARLEEIQANVGPVRLAGAVGLDLAGLTPALASYDVSVTAKHPDLAGLASALGWDAGLAESFGGIDLNARLHGDLGRMRVEGLSGNLGPVDLSGRLSADFAGERPNFVAVLETGDLPLDLALGRGIDPASLRDFDARLDLDAAALTHHALRVERVGLSASLTAGLLDLERFSGSFHGGALQLDGKADLRDEIAAEFAVTAIEVDLGEFLRDQAGIAGIAGPVYFNGDFTMRGTSVAELASGLAGEAEMSGLLTFDGEPGTEVGSGADGLQDMSDLGAFLARTFGPDSVRLAGTFTAEAGQLQTENTRLDGQPAYALTLAKLDLPGWTLDGVTDIYERSAGRPLISSIAYGGPLDDLEVESLDLPESPAPEVAEEPAEEAQPEPEAEEPPEPAAEEAPVPIVQEPAVPEVEELAAPEVEDEPEPQAEQQAVPEAEEAPEPEVEVEPAPLVSETAEPAPVLPEIGEEAEAQTEPAEPAEVIEPVQPEPEPQPASPAAPAEDDLLKDLLKLGG